MAQADGHLADRTTVEDGQRRMGAPIDAGEEAHQVGAAEALDADQLEGAVVQAGVGADAHPAAEVTGVAQREQ